MSSEDIRYFFDERRQEVGAYLDLIGNIDRTRQQGAFSFAENEVSISPLQQQILYANVFVQLYNLVEATITRCLKELHEAATAGHKAGDLTAPVLREWVRFKARTHTDRAHDRRLDAAVELTNHLVASLPVDYFEVEAGGGGNWDDRKIENVAGRIGCDIGMDASVREMAKRHERDEYGALQLVKELRNRLAHGLMSFGECGSDLTVSDIERIAGAVLGYLNAVVDSFVLYLDEHRFLERQQTADVA